MQKVGRREGEPLPKILALFVEGIIDLKPMMAGRLRVEQMALALGLHRLARNLKPRLVLF
tara:strand:- start:858 stop:1037 length:180 start_codon:yes stop_codon:yes gene_type:complete